jgi:putative transposase
MKVNQMLPHWILTLLMIVIEALSARRDAKIRFLKLQVELLRGKLPGNRVILAPEDRQRLLRLGEQMDHRVHDVIGIVCVNTYRRWVQEQDFDRVPGRVGRPRKMTQSVRDLVVRLARESIGWGVRRIVGELRKLAVMPSRSSVRRVLEDEGILPDPDRRAPNGVMTPWRTFIKMHMDVIVACDFFSKNVWTPFGKRQSFSLMFIHLQSRKVFVSPSTFNPTGEWMQQQARNVTMWLEDQGLELGYLIRDRDGKYAKTFDAWFEQFGQVIKTPFQSPVANAFAESWIGTLKRECLNHFVCFSLKHLDYIVQTYVGYYNVHRPHQSLSNLPIGTDEPPEQSPPLSIGCKKSLGGLLNHYYRKAA